MAGSVERTVSEDVPATPDQVRDHYVDLDNIKNVHPLVVSVVTLNRSDSDDGYVQSYRVQDRIPLGFATLPISYTATLRVPRSGPVLTEARQFPAVRLDGVVSFDPIPAGTRLTARTRNRAPRPLLGLTARQRVAAHTEMLAGIRRHFETRA
jgi:hypothetical protein